MIQNSYVNAELESLGENHPVVRHTAQVLCCLQTVLESDIHAMARTSVRMH